MHPLAYPDTQTARAPLKEFNNPPLKSCFYWHLVRWLARSMGLVHSCYTTGGVRSADQVEHAKRRLCVGCKHACPSYTHTCSTGYRRAEVIPEWMRPRWRLFFDQVPSVFPRNRNGTLALL